MYIFLILAWEQKMLPIFVKFTYMFMPYLKKNVYLDD